MSFAKFLLLKYVWDDFFSFDRISPLDAFQLSEVKMVYTWSSKKYFWKANNSVLECIF